MAAAAYGGKIMKDLGLIPEGYKIMVVGSVQEEDCDGMCWQSIVNEYFNGPEDARNRLSSSSPPSRPTAASIAVIAAEWKSASTCTVFPATAPRPSAATTRSTRWRKLS